jgi:hypothetical protein
MGEAIDTLADLLKPELQAVCVGINPAPRRDRIRRAGAIFSLATDESDMRAVRQPSLVSVVVVERWCAVPTRRC